MAATDKPVLSVKALCRATGLSAETVRYHLTAGQWPGVRLGRRGYWRIPVTVLDALAAGVDPATLKAPAAAPLPEVTPR